MPKIKISQYGKANTTLVEIGELDLYFSYQTIVAFRDNGKLRVCNNIWSNTTGKHLNLIDGGDKKSRLDSKNFDELLQQTLKAHSLE